MSIVEARTFVRNCDVIVQSQLNTRRRNELSVAELSAVNVISDDDRSEEYTG
jgi:hypothetical protein